MRLRTLVFGLGLVVTQALWPAPAAADQTAPERGPTGDRTTPPASRPTGDRTTPPASRPTGDRTTPPAWRPTGDRTTPPASRPTDDPARDFAAANDAYAKGHYDEAAALYRRLAESVPQADVLFNLGTAEAQAGHLGSAVWAFEQALVYRPGDEDARHNLDVVRQRALRRGLSEGGELRVILPGDDDVGTGLVTALTPTAVAVGFAAAWLAFFGLLTALRLRGRASDQAGGATAPASDDTRQTMLTLGAVVAGLAALAFGSLLLGRILVLREATYAVVTADRGTIQAGPGAQYRAVARVMAGVKLRIRGEDGAWSNVVLPDGGTGWLPTPEIARLENG